MAKSDEEFHALMQEVLAGSDAAAKELFRDYEPFLLRAIRRKLSKRIRPKFDSIDFTQDVWASFFAREPEHRVFETSDDLMAFLTRLAQNKVTDAARQQFRAQKYNVNREQSMDDSTRFDKDWLRGADPTPSQIVMSQEEWQEFLRKQPLVYRRILILLREGKTAAVIAQELNIHPRTVQRVAERFMPGWNS